MFAVSPNVLAKNLEVRKIFLLFQNDPQGSLKAVLTNAPNCFCQKSDIDKIAFRNSEKFSEKAPLVTYYAVYRTQQKNLPFPAVFGSKYEEEESIFFFFFKKMFSSKCCPGLKKCKLSKSAEVFYAKVRKNYFNVRNRTKNLTEFPNNVFRQKNDSMDTWKAILTTPPKSLTKNSTEIQKQKHSEKFLRIPNMPLKERSQKFLPLSERFSLEVWKTKKSFFKDIVLLKMFLWAKRTEILPHC